MSITIRIREVYGSKLYYPADRNAEVFCFLAGKKTLSQLDISRIKELGYEIKVEQETL